MEPKMGMTRFSVRRVLETILRRWYWPLIFAIIFATIFSYFFWTGYNSSYQVSSTFIPLSAQTNYYTASALAKNDMVLDAVKNSVSFKTTIGELNDAIAVETEENSVAVKVNITWGNRDEAMEILEALKANLSFTVTHSAKAGEIRWMDAASSDSMQGAPSATQTYQIFFVGALIGLLLGAFFSCFLGSIDKRVFNIETVRYGRDVTTIGVVGEIKEILSTVHRSKKPEVTGRSNKQFVAATLYLNKLMDTGNKKLIMCTAPKSKCGTSTIVRNIAKMLSGFKANILIISVINTTEAINSEPKMRAIYSGVYKVALTMDEKESYGIFYSKISRMLSLAEKKFKLVLVDCPALLDNVHNSVIAEVTDAALLVNHYGVTKRDEVAAAASLLSRSGAQSIYSIWNFIEKQHGYYYPTEDASDEGKVINE